MERVLLRSSEIIVRVFRAELAESAHRGHIAVVRADCRILYELGDPCSVTFARSSAKPLQAIPVLESGAAEAFGLTDREIAVICASHNGEEEHTSAVRSILAKLGKSPDDLQCGVQEPYHKATADRMKERGERPTSLHNNCSGKHAGMIALALAMNAPAQHYISAEHPVQRRMLDTVAEMSGVPAGEIALGIDGCGVPVFGLPLCKLAAAYARLGAPDGLPPHRADACRRIIGALRNHPAMLAGQDRFDTHLIEATQGRIVGKMGAEGVFALTVPDARLGVAVKVEDGALRALYPAVVEALRQLQLLTPQELNRLAPFHRPPVVNRRGEQVGRIEPAFTLHAAT